MLINNSLDEVKKREKALSVIREIVRNDGRSHLYDLTGLAGGFIVNDGDIELLETYVGPAVFEDALQEVGKAHMGGEKIFALNRTSSGILATVLSLVGENSSVVHYLPELPGHPSIPRSCELVNADYREFDDFEEFHIPENTDLVVVTGSTMDHRTIDEEIFKKIIDMAHERDIPVLVDDASGARLRTVVYNQKRACDLGADIVITSTDKLMPGPRGGLMAGREDLVDIIKSKAHQFGLEAQPPAILAMVNGLKNFNSENLISSFSKKEELYGMLSENFKGFELSPTGVSISPEKLADEISSKTDLSQTDLASLFSMILLNDFGIITIPAVSMPGASQTIRFDLSTNDALRLDLDELNRNILSSFSKLAEIVDDEEKCREILF